MKTRLNPSFTAGQRLRRGRLRDWAEAGAPVVVVTAPAGYGKSSLLYELTHDSPDPVAWYNMDCSDREPYTWLGYLAEVVFHVLPEVARGAREMVGRQDRIGPQLILTTLINDIAEDGRPLSLVLDDLHLVDDHPEIAELLRRLVVFRPPNLRLFLSTRRSLELPLARLEAAQQAIRLEPQDLLFTRSELVRLFKLWGLELGQSALDTVHSLTRGWAAGLVLLRNTLERGGELPASESFPAAGCPQLFHYTAEEVLEGLGPALSHFLEATCVLDTFDHDAAAFMSGLASDAVLAELDRQGLFLVHLDDRATNFRYHHLFAEFLRARLRARDAARWRALHLRAAQYYGEEPATALRHLMAAGDCAAAGALLVDHGVGLVQSGRVEEVAGWLDELGDPGELQAVRGAVAEHRGDWRLAVRCYTENGDARGLQLAAACLARYGDREGSLQFIRQADRLCPRDDPVMRARILVWLGGIMLYVGEDVTRAEELAAEGFLLARRQEDFEALAGGYVTYAFMGLVAKGHFARAAHLLEEGVEWFEAQEHLYMAFHLMVDLTLTHLVACDLERARSWLERCEGYASRFEGSWIGVGHELNRATLALLEGRFGDGLSHLDRLARLEVPLNIRAWFLRVRLLLHLHLRQLEPARAMAEQMREVVELQGHEGFYSLECHLALAQLHQALGELDRAESVALSAWETASRNGWLFWKMKACAWVAWLRLSSGGDVAEPLQAALSLSQQGGYERYWTQEPLGMGKTLLARAVALDIESAYAERLAPDTVEEQLRVVTLGGFHLRVGQREIARSMFRRKKVVQLLQLMLSRPNLSVLVDEAMEILWPGAEPDRARHYLSVHVSGIRRVLGPLVECSGDAYRLTGVRLDWVEFEQTVEQAERHLRDGAADQALSTYLAAYASYGGKYLPEGQYLDFTRVTRERLERRFRSCLERIAELYHRAGDLREALLWLDRAWRHEPPCPRLGRRLAALHREMGDPDSATTVEAESALLDGFTA